MSSQQVIKQINVASITEAETLNYGVTEENNKKTRYLASYIVGYIAATIARKKPATLMTLSKIHNMLFELWDKFSKELFYTNHIDYHELRRNNISRTILFYHGPKMEELLNEKEIKQFLSDQGYKTDSLENVLSTLKRRYSSFQSSQMFPHEIGIFLGIPLKDVKGFMKLSSLPRAKISGKRWVIYGDLEISLEVMEEYKEAESKVRGLLSLKDPIKILNGII
jgi:hypothetical protein